MYRKVAKIVKRVPCVSFSQAPLTLTSHILMVPLSKLKIGTTLLAKLQTLYFNRFVFGFFFTNSLFSVLGANSGYHIAFNIVAFTFLFFFPTFQPKDTGSSEEGRKQM